MNNFKKPGEEALRKSLTEEQFKVTQKAGTERPFQNAYWDNKEAGIYVDIISGEPLFSSTDKFDSGTGWPSFSKPLVKTNITEHEDTAHNMRRTEVRSTNADSHLGHLFNDGPQPSGQRYCINSAALKFIPASELSAQGYTAYEHLFPHLSKTKHLNYNDTPDPTETETEQLNFENSLNAQEIATFAGGCFWGMQEIIREIPGVTKTKVGYTGGNIENATYEIVKTGRSGHAEALQVTFDPSQLKYKDLLSVFFRMHDPTTVNQQGNDIGTQYRSEIFYHSDQQKQIAEKVISEVESAGKWKKPIVTLLNPASTFYKAEDYHQDYLQKNPGGYTCHYLRD